MFFTIAVLGTTASSESCAQVFEISLPAKNIAYSSATGMLYVTVPSSAGIPYGNGLVEISPTDASITGNVYVGSEPNPLATSPDQPIAYVGLDGANAVRPVDLTTLIPGAQFSLGSDRFLGPYTAQQIAVMPGAANTVAVSLSPGGGGAGNVAIFDSGVMRGSINPSIPFANAIAFGPTANQLYGYDNYDTSFGLSKYSIDTTGISSATYVSNVIRAFYATIVVDASTIYSTSGATVDATSLQLVGTYETSGPVVVDDSAHWVIFAHQNNVQVYDRETFVQIFSMLIPGATGNPISATGCGSRCVAIVFNSGQIFIVSNVEYIFDNGFE